MKIIFALLGGLGLFLYGMTIMGDGLEKAAGDKMKRIIEVLTNNRIIAVVVGALVTMIIQSSSATTVMVVGFVNAGIMTLTQATGIIMGANIGTTVTAQIASLDLNKIAPLVVGLAVGVWMFSENKRTKNIAEIFIGFGILFIGMDYMKQAVKPLKEFEGFKTMMLSFGKGTFVDSFLAVLTGFVVTAIVQSSSAATGILIALASEGFLPIEASLPIIFGTNIGTCVTALLSSIGANRTAKRAAFIHFMFNIIGTLVFMIFFRGLTIHLVTTISPDSAARQLANAHTFFNIANTLLLLPFAPLLVKLANTIIPVKDYEIEEVTGIKHLDDRILETPSIAIVQVVKETLNMGQLALENYKKSIDAFIEKNEKYVHDVFKKEKVINQMEHEIAAYLVKLSNTALSAEQHDVVNGLFSTINDIERVGDHSDNLAELSLYTIEHDLCFSDTGMAELDEIHSKVVEAYEQSLVALKTGDLRAANKVIQIEGEVDALEKSLRANHIQRLNKQQCSPESGVIFLDMLSNLERIADHASNIAMAVIDRNQK